MDKELKVEVWQYELDIWNAVVLLSVANTVLWNSVYSNLIVGLNAIRW